MVVERDLAAAATAVKVAVADGVVHPNIFAEVVYPTKTTQHSREEGGQPALETYSAAPPSGGVRAGVGGGAAAPIRCISTVSVATKPPQKKNPNPKPIFFISSLPLNIFPPSLLSFR